MKKGITDYYFFLTIQENLVTFEKYKIQTSLKHFKSRSVNVTYVERQFLVTLLFYMILTLLHVHRTGISRPNT